MYTDFQDILTEKNRKKSVLDQSNSKVWVQFVAKPGQKIPVVKELIRINLGSSAQSINSKINARINIKINIL